MNTEVNHVKKVVTKCSDDKFNVHSQVKNNLPQDAFKHEVSSCNVSQNALNIPGRVCALQSNQNSVQDGGWPNNGGGTYHNSHVVGNFASMTKRECPCTSGGIAIS